MYVTQALHRNLQQIPDAIAVEYQGASLTYRQLAARVARLAGALHRLGVKDNDRVAIMARNSARYIEYIYAVPWAGGALNPINVRWSVEEVTYSLNDSETKILIVDDTFVHIVEEIHAQSSILQLVIYAGDGETPEGMYSYEALIAEHAPIEDRMRRGDDLLGVFYTGGTTGFPKGVMVNHTGFVFSVMALMDGNLAPDGARFLHVAPMFHMADFFMLGGVTLRGGVHIVLPSFEPQSVVETIERCRVTQALLVPTMVHLLLDTLEDGRADTSSLESIFYGASPMPIGTLKRAIELLPHTDFTQVYGMTELSPIGTWSPPENHTQEAIESGRVATIGRPALCVEIKIADELGKEVTRGIVGELLVRGPNVMPGYWGKPKETAEAVVDGWMHTGDGGYMDDDGNIYIVDRIKDMIISGGENVYSAEVENALSQHRDVAQCAVIGIPNEEWGEIVHAVIVPVQGASPELSEIHDFCRNRIAGYKCPRSISLLDTLPVSGAGKVLKVELRKLYRE